ncbi:hypothetical protein DXG01_010009, partial [Tephrocybe rancida]
FSATDNAPSPAPAPTTEGENHGDTSPVTAPTDDQVPNQASPARIPSLLATSLAIVDIGGGPIYPGIGEAGPLAPAGESVVPAINVINPTPVNSQDLPPLPRPPAL